MSNAPKQKSEKVKSVGTRRAETYHGVRLPKPRDTPRFSVEEIRRAVDNAIDKNLDLLKRRKSPYPDS